MLPLLCCSSSLPPAQSQVLPSLLSKGNFPQGGMVEILLDGAVTAALPNPNSTWLQKLSCTSGFIPYLLSEFGAGGRWPLTLAMELA